MATLTTGARSFIGASRRSTLFGMEVLNENASYGTVVSSDCHPDDLTHRSSKASSGLRRGSCYGILYKAHNGLVNETRRSSHPFHPTKPFVISERALFIH